MKWEDGSRRCAGHRSRKGRDNLCGVQLLHPPSTLLLPLPGQWVQAAVLHPCAWQ